MRGALLVFLFFFGLSTIQAQTGFKIKSNPVDTMFDATTGDPVGKGYVTNTGSDTIILMWSFEQVSGPLAWVPYFCDKNLCYGPGTTECPDDNPVVLAPGETGNLDLHILATALVECGTYDVTVWERGNPDNSVVVPYNYNCVSSNDDIVLQNLQVFPNPARYYFVLSEEITDSYMTITNLLGKPVQQFRIVQNGSYSVEDLPTGMYMVNIYSNEGDHLKSVRLKKQ